MCIKIYSSMLEMSWLIYAHLQSNKSINSFFMNIASRYTRLEASSQTR